MFADETKSGWGGKGEDICTRDDVDSFCSGRGGIYGDGLKEGSCKGEGGVGGSTANSCGRD